MAIKKIIENALNEQIKKELESSYIYLAMSAYFETQNLSGFASWMKLQSDEERIHAMKLYQHVLDRDGTIDLLAIPKPNAKWNSPLEVFQGAYNRQ